MALLQISEPGQSPAPHQRKLAAGIDLGTTNSLVATVRSGSADTLADDQGRHLLPSIVRYLDDGVQVGDDAAAAAIQDPLNTIVSVKRLMGRGVADVCEQGQALPYQFVDKEGMALLRTRQGDKSPVEISAEILKSLVKRAQASLDGSLDGVVITVPAYFDEAQRQATKDAARLAGVNLLRLLSEPTAAALAYGLDRSAEGVIAVYDLGGGTFDISILRLNKGVFEVLATGGDSALGGDDFDLAVATWIAEQAGQILPALSAEASRELMMLARRVKEQLTDEPQVDVAFAGWQGVLAREQFDALIEPLVARTVRTCKRALRDAKVKQVDVSNVVMVGGSTRVKHVRNSVEAWFGREPLVDIDPDRVVAVGAAIQADILAGNKPDSDMLLLDVIPLSLGLETMGGLMEKVIHRNTTIPVGRAQEFTTYRDGQTAMAIHVLQGERELIKDNRSLARFELRGIPPMAAGAAKIRVSFQVDADGLLSVSAKELSSGVASSIEVKPSYGLSDEEITRMLQDSYSHARDDMDARNLREQQVEADRLIEALQAAMATDGERLLTMAEQQALAQEIETLVALRNGSDWQAIEAGIEQLAAASNLFAARRMDTSIKEALSGQRVDDLEQ